MTHDAPVPPNAAAQDALNGPSVEGGEKGWSFHRK